MLYKLWQTIKSWVNYLLRRNSNPEVLLESLKIELEDKLLLINVKVAGIVSLSKKMEVEKAEIERLIALLDSQINEAMLKGPECENAAKLLIKQMVMSNKELQEKEELLEQARDNAQSALDYRQDFETQARSKINEIEILIARSQHTDVIREIIRIKGTVFEVNSVTSILSQAKDEVLEKEALAKAEKEIAEDSITYRIQSLQESVDKKEISEIFEEKTKQIKTRSVLK